MILKPIHLLLIVVLLIGVAFWAFDNKKTSAEQNIKWEYAEIVFGSPVTFGTNISSGYLYNGAPVTPQDSTAKVASLFGYLGSQGWELVSNASNMSFIFKRQVP